MVELARKVLKNLMYNFLSTFATRFVGLIITVILARLLDPEAFGTYMLSLSIAYLLLALSDFGINSALIRFVSYLVGINDDVGARSYFRYLFKLKLLTTVISSSSIILFSGIVAAHVFHKPELSTSLAIVGLFLFFMSFLDFFNSSFVSINKFEFYLMKNSIFELSRIIAIPFFIFLIQGVYGALIGTVVSAIITLFIIIYSIFHYFSHLYIGPTTVVKFKDLSRYLSYLTLGSISGVVFVYVDSIMLGILLPVEYVGFYRAAYNVVFAIIGMVSIVNVLLPLFTQLEGRELENAFEKLFRYSSVLGVPSAFGLVLLGEPIIKMVYGVEYLHALAPLYILSLLVISAPLDFFGTLFNAKGKPEYFAKLVIISFTLNVILNYYLINIYGIVGAAVATVASSIFKTIALGLLSKRIFDIFPKFDVVYRSLLSSMVMALFLYITPMPTGILSMVGTIMAAAVIYFIMIFLIKGLREEDVIYMLRILGQDKILNWRFKDPK